MDELYKDLNKNGKLKKVGKCHGRMTRSEKKAKQKEIEEILKEHPLYKNAQTNQLVNIAARLFDKYSKDEKFCEKEFISCLIHHLEVCSGDAEYETIFASTEASKTEYDLTEPEWKAALMKELKAHEGVFRAATEEEIKEYKHRLIPCKLLLSIKRCGRKKARMVCLGFLAPQTRFATFASVADLTVIKLMLALTVASDGVIDILSADATSAFLQSPYPELALINLDERLQELLGYKIGRVLKGMNGLPLSSACWAVHRDKTLVDLGWKPNQYERTVWSKDGAICIIFVDNFYFFGSTAKIKNAYEELKEPLKLVLEPPKETAQYKVYDVLGIEVAKSNIDHSIVLSQDEYITKLLNRFGGAESNSYVPNPMHELPKESDTELVGDEKLKWTKIKQELTGSIQYLTNTRADIVMALKVSAKSKPGEETTRALKRIIRYLRKRRALKFNNNKTKYGTKIVIEVWTDSDFASLGHRFSTSGIVLCINGNPIYCKSQTQPQIAASVSEAELVAMSEGAKVGSRIRNLVQSLLPTLDNTFQDVGADSYTLIGTFEQFADNMGAIKFANTNIGTSRLKHLHIKDALVRDYVERGVCKLQYVESKKNKANALTKICTGEEFKLGLSQLQIYDM